MSFFLRYYHSIAVASIAIVIAAVVVIISFFPHIEPLYFTQNRLLLAIEMTCVENFKCDW